MPYAEGRVVHDADSHVVETPEWFEPYADPRDPGAHGPRLREHREAGRGEVHRRASASAGSIPPTAPRPTPRS